jgi:deazaflavin-dependent oxidoreductase (nitroreductase family)
VDKFTFTRALAKYVVNPISKLGAGRVPGTALLETTGRSSGRARITPVGYSRDGETVWIVSEHGLRADYVRNIDKDPNVRVKIRGHWHRGQARVAPDEDPKQHLQKQSNQLSAATVRVIGTGPVVVRIDLERR